MQKINEQNFKSSEVKKPYAMPKLIDFGRVRSVTTGGSQTGMEGGTGGGVMDKMT